MALIQMVEVTGEALNKNERKWLTVSFLESYDQVKRLE